MCRSIVRLVAHLSSRTAVHASFPQKSQRSPPPVSQTSLALRVEPHAAKHSAEQHSTSGDPHELTRSTFAPHSFTSHAHEMRHILPLRVPGRAAGGHVLADRAQKPSAGTAGRLPVQCHVHKPPVCEAAASPVSRRCTAVPIGAEGAAPSERSERHLRSWDRRTGDQDHRGRCPADQSRPWGRIRGARVAID